MAQLRVRGIDEALIEILKRRAACNGRSPEAEHRAILEEAPRPMLPEKSFKEMLLEIPPVGEDEDFARPHDLGREVDL